MISFLCRCFIFYNVMCCSQCGPNYKKIKFEWRNNSITHLYPPPYIGCVGGCDTTFLDIMRINLSSVRQVADNRTQTSSNNRQNVNSNRNTNTVTVMPSRQPQLRQNTITNYQQIQTNTTNNLPRQNYTPNNQQGQQPRQFIPPPPANRNQNMNNQRMPLPRGGGGDADDNNVMCGCNNPAVLLTVRKQNANFGKYSFSFIGKITRKTHQ